MVATKLEGFSPYRQAMLDVIEADMVAHKEIAVRGREALTYLDDCFRKEQPCYRWVPLNETMMAAIPKGGSWRSGLGNLGGRGKGGWKAIE